MFSAPNYHVKKILALVDVKAIRTRQFRVALETVNGGAIVTAKPLLTALGCTVAGLNIKTNGDFTHPPEPNPKNLAAFTGFIKKKRADIGFALDPDGDRLVLVSPTHGVISEECTLALVVRHFLTNITKGPVVINQSTSRMNEDIARENKCKLYRAPVGEVNVVTEMRKRGAIIGGEGNGGIIDPRLHHGRDGMAGIALILDSMARANKTIDELVAALPRYSIVKDKVAVGATDFKLITEKLIAEFADVKHTKNDGVRFAWADRWLHVRTSNTEPIIRFIAEAPTTKESEALIFRAKKSLAKLIKLAA